MLSIIPTAVLHSATPQNVPQSLLFRGAHHPLLPLVQTQPLSQWLQSLLPALQSGMGSRTLHNPVVPHSHQHHTIPHSHQLLTTPHSHRLPTTHTLPPISQPLPPGLQWLSRCRLVVSGYFVVYRMSPSHSAYVGQSYSPPAPPPTQVHVHVLAQQVIV